VTALPFGAAAAAAAATAAVAARDDDGNDGNIEYREDSGDGDLLRLAANATMQS